MRLEFFHAITPPEEYVRVHAECVRCGMTEAEAADQVERLKMQAVYRDKDEIYQVAVSEIGNPFHIANGNMVWLSIKRVDREAFHDWRVMQAIKNALVGEECEAFELYPAESRLVDTSNQYHLWAFKSPRPRLPVGFQDRLVMGPDPNTRAKQRPFETV